MLHHTYIYISKKTEGALRCIPSRSLSWLGGYFYDLRLPGLDIDEKSSGQSSFSLSKYAMSIHFGGIMWLKQCHVYHPPVITFLKVVCRNHSQLMAGKNGSQFQPHKSPFSDIPIAHWLVNMTPRTFGFMMYILYYIIQYNIYICIYVCMVYHIIHYINVFMYIYNV